MTDLEAPPAREAPERATARRNGRIIGTALAVAAVILVAAWIGRQFPPRSTVRIAVALVQGAVCAWLIVMSTRPARHLDEMQRRIQIEALAFGFAGTAIVFSAYGFLVSAGLPEIDSSLIWPVMVVLWAIGTVIACRRYR
jgi:hypothetical protein